MLAQENVVPRLLAGYLARQRELFPVHGEDTTIGGVHAYAYTPEGGVAAENRDRVLINRHGGAFANAGRPAPSSSRCRSLRSAASRS
jgi:hypothetical protein